jgi:metallo-beta-lactamase family protein
MATLQFLGAAQTVTGSRFVLEVGGSRAMVDCGLFQGLKELRQRNWDPLPLNPASINWVLLTHAHIDHTGYLPRLVHDGFDGTVYATEATADLLQIMLPDSAKIQEEEADYANRKGYSKHKPALPLYTEDDARRTLKLLEGVPYGRDLRINKFLRARFVSIGHILGSSYVEATIEEPDRVPIKIIFSGDIGRYEEPILNDPSPAEEADYLLVESTYGDRQHEDSNPKERLAEIINATVTRGGKVIIPAFAIGRTQLLIYYLRELEDEGRIPVIPVFVDSPMSAAATRLYMKHKSDHDLDMQGIEKTGKNPLTTNLFSLVQGRKGSRGLNDLGGPAILISAAGMATGGRVLHHLANGLPEPANTVIFVGYQAVGTRGRRLQEGEKETRIHGQSIPVRAHIESIGSLSAHADSNEIMRWLSGFKQPPKTTFIVHGEPRSSEALKSKIIKELGWNAVIPTYLEKIDL